MVGCTLELMDEHTARRICGLIAGVIATDDEFHRDELKFLLRMFDAFGLSKSDDNQVVRPTVKPAEAAAQIAELPDDVRGETVGLLVEAAVADGKLSDEERVYLEAVGEAAGLPPAELVDRALERIASSD